MYLGVNTTQTHKYYKNVQKHWVTIPHKSTTQLTTIFDYELHDKTSRLQKWKRIIDFGIEVRM